MIVKRKKKVSISEDGKEITETKKTDWKDKAKNFIGRMKESQSRYHYSSGGVPEDHLTALRMHQSAMDAHNLMTQTAINTHNMMTLGCV